MNIGSHKAMVLLSGGLDSSLAACIVRDLGIELSGIHFTNVFNGNYDGGAMPESIRCCADEIGIPAEVEDVSAELLELVASPPHGHGAHLNPCIDCRIMALRRAWRHAQRTGAEFLVTGEVLGQRPMSQRRGALDIIDRETGIGDRILRPLSAKHLKPTEPERLGWVDRSKLLEIKGRGRKTQLGMAEKLGLKSYGTPAGGCLLTEAFFSAKVKDLMEHGDLNCENIMILRAGRSYRGPGGELIIVGRNEEQNARLAALVRPGDEVLSARESSPLTVLRPGGSSAGRQAAARITARHCKARGGPSVEILYGPALDEWAGSVVVAPAGEDMVGAMRTGRS